MLRDFERTRKHTTLRQLHTRSTVQPCARVEVCGTRQPLLCAAAASHARRADG